MSSLLLVISASCDAMEALCRSSWAPTVDAIVVGGLEFHGYRTIDPATLRKDEATRTESTVSGDFSNEGHTKTSSTEVGAIGIFPLLVHNDVSTSSVSVSRSKEKTVVVNGASFDDLRLEDRQRLMELAGAQSVLSTRVVVGANYNVWRSSESVEILVKLSDAKDGSMRWATRCVASAVNFRSVDAAIEGAARCAVAAITAHR